MKLKKYIGETMHIALSRAREDLGEGISILENREVKNKHLEGGKGVEITVALLEDETAAATGNNSDKPVRDARADAYFNDFLNEAVGDVPKGSGTGNAALEQEVQILRQELLKLNSSLRRIVTGDFPQEFSRVFESLQNSGISRQDTEELTRHAYFRLESQRSPEFKQILTSMKGEIESHFPMSGNIFSQNKARIYTFIGPTGVGKTTTLMKIAGNPTILGDRKAGIITTDTYRLAGTDALKVFAKVSSVPLVECRDAADLPAALKQLSDRDIILIDTAGRSPYFPNYIQELQSFVGTGSNNKVILTLSATSDVDDLYLSAGLYSVLKPMGIIFTKLDETGRPGKIYSMVKHLGIPPLYFTRGQAVPQDIIPAGGQQFWNILTESIV